MATVVIHKPGTGTLRVKNITNILSCLKSESIVKYSPKRYHHVALDTCRNYTRRWQQRKSFIPCSTESQSSFLGVAVVRSVSSGVVPEDLISKVTERVGNTVGSVVSDGLRSSEDSTQSSVIRESAPSPPSLASVPEPPPVSAEVVTTSSVSETLAPLGNIPEPPAIPPVVEELVQTLPLSGEPPFESLGLGGWSPVGIVQNCMEYLHIGCDLPWWTSIVIGTVVVRVLIFPLVILTQRNAARMSIYLPQLQTLQLKMGEARQSGNQLEASRYAQELVLFMKEKQLNPLKNLLVPLAQAPLFISFFMGLRGMTNVPVDSMRTGGIFWFTDLTMVDQFYLLPVITSATMWLTIEVGADSTKLSEANMQTMKYILRAMPVCILPFTINFPGAILVYWASSNFVSLLQVGFLRIPAVRDYFKIERAVTHTPDSLPVKPKGFVEGLRDSWTNMKITREMEDRQRLDEMQFQRAGRGPVQKTYKYDPTQPRNISSTGKDAAIAAKRRDRY